MLARAAFIACIFTRVSLSMRIQQGMRARVYPAEISVSPSVVHSIARSVLLNDVGMDTFWTHSCSKCPKCVQGSVQTKLFGHILAQSVQFMSKMCPTELLVSKLQVYLDIFWTLCANICPIQKLWCPKCVQKVGHIIDIKRTKSSLPKMCPNLG